MWFVMNMERFVENVKGKEGLIGREEKEGIFIYLWILNSIKLFGRIWVDLLVFVKNMRNKEYIIEFWIYLKDLILYFVGWRIR